MPSDEPRVRVAVVGAGPAGVRAAEALARHGVKPILLDEAAAPGGQIYRRPPPGAERPAAEIYGLEARKAVAIHDAVPALGGQIDYRPDTLVWNVSIDDDEVRADTLRDGVAGVVGVDRLIVATGAMDRVVPFAGWTLPGVFTLSAAQIALKSQGVAIGRRVVLAGAGPLLPLLAAQYLDAGITPAIVLDLTPLSAKIRAVPGLLTNPATFARGLRYVARAITARVPFAHGVRAIRALGETRVVGIGYTDSSGVDHEIACDALAASFGLVCESQLADLAGCRFRFDDSSRQWQPVVSSSGRSSQPLVYLAGDGAAIGGADVAERAGERAALAVLEDTGVMVERGRIDRLELVIDWASRFRRALSAAYPFPDALIDGLDDETMVCRCEGISAGVLRQCARERAPAEINQLKAFTRVGMGRCQGRVCGLAAAEILARERGMTLADAGRLRAQPPVKPIPLGIAAATRDGA